MPHNRLADFFSRPGYDEPPPLYVVIGLDRSRLLETRELEEAKGFCDQWQKLGYPTPHIVTKR